MPLDVDEIALSENMEQALRSVLALGPDSVGALRVASGATKGTLIIAQGFIVSANINGLEKTGVRAVEHLLRLDSAAFHFLEDQAITSSQLRQCRVCLDELLKNKLSLEGLKVEPMSDEEVLSAEAMLAATFDRVNSAMTSGQGTPTMEIPDDVYKKFMDLLKNETPSGDASEIHPAIEVDESAQERPVAGASGELQPPDVVPPSVPELQSATELQPNPELSPAPLPDLSSWTSGSFSKVLIEAEVAKAAESAEDNLSKPEVVEEAVFVNIATFGNKNNKNIDARPSAVVSEVPVEMLAPSAEPTQRSYSIGPGVTPPLNESPILDYESLNSIPTPKAAAESASQQAEKSSAPAPALLPRISDPNATSTRLSRTRSGNNTSIEPGFIDRVQQVVTPTANEPRPQVGGSGIGKVLGPFVLVALGVAIFMVPQTLQNQMSSLDTPVLAEQRMSPVVNRAMASVMPYPYLTPSSSD